MNFLGKNYWLIIVLLTSYSPLSASHMILYNLNNATNYESNFVHLTEMYGDTNNKLQVSNANEKSNAILADVNRQLSVVLKSFDSSENVAKKVRDLMAQGANAELLYNDGTTLLDAAFTWPDHEVARALLEWSPTLINFPDAHKNVPLHTAIRKKDIRRVRFLLRNGADINLKNNEKLHPLKLVIAGARYNRHDARGGCSYWPITQELIEIIAKKSSVNIIAKVCKDIKINCIDFFYCNYIYQPLAEILEEKKLKATKSKKRRRKEKAPGEPVLKRQKK